MTIENKDISRPVIVCHGGAGSNPDHVDGVQQACAVGLKTMQQEGGGALDGVIAAAQVLEDDVRFNAGTGSSLRLDGTSIQMDASCMTDGGQFAAIAAIERVKNPIVIARHLLETPHVLLVGDGATAFARQLGVKDYDPTTPGAQERLRKVVAAGGSYGEWTRTDLEKNWNYDMPLSEALGCDTIGSIAWDGQNFASALSTGGTTTVLRGRVGDVPLPGCGLFVGKHGAVCLTGDGEHFVRSMLAYRGYAELERGRSPEETVEWALGQVDETVDIGVIVLNHNGFAGGARDRMAWHGQYADL
jgi:isoaspartyl peptidase/L-asparaginase-like protein (Ntn-hydrolase superfamily)